MPDADEVDGEGFAKGARPLCPFCSKPFSPKMMSVWAEAETSLGYYGETDIDGISVDIDISCDGCDRLIYRKTVVDARFGWKSE